MAAVVDLAMPYRVLTLLAVALLAGGCASSDRGNTIQFSGSEDPVANAQVTPLFGNRGPDGLVTALAVDPNNRPVLTDEDGNFRIDYETVPTVAGVQVTIDVPSVTGGAVGRLDWRAALDDPTAPNLELEIPQPTACDETQDCGAPLLPDLVPIIGSSDLDPAVVARFESLEDGPPTAGLFPAETWFVEDTESRRLLRFATVAANTGEGPLDIIALPGVGESSQTWQRIWTDRWNFRDSLSGEFIFHPTHDHVHFDAFERYTLLDTAGTIVAESEKVSFCLRDSVRVVDGLPSPIGPMLVDDGSCEGQQQVINPGFGDHYHALLDDQWIDITGVPAGDYVVEISVDPLDLIIESDESNNVASFPVTLEP